MYINSIYYIFTSILRFLATGSSFSDLAFRFRMGVSTVSKIIYETIDAIIATLLNIAIPSSRSEEEWKQIAEEYFLKWNFPNCLGALDGKHVHIFAPNKSGSFYFNYKSTFSINLMALVDANYRFVMVDIGGYGSSADSTIFKNCSFGKSWIDNPEKLNIPANAPLPGATKPVPYVLIAGEAFGLKSTIMRPFPGKKLTQRERIFNYRFTAIISKPK